MAGNPNRDERHQGRNYQLGRRRFTKSPGYGAVLFRAFPFKVRKSREEVGNLVASILLVDEGEGDDWIERGAGMMTGFAVTEHPGTTDGSVTLWMSQEVADFFLNMGDLSSVEVTSEEHWD